MPNKVCRMALIAVLSVCLARPARSETITAARDQLVIGIVVVGAAVAVLITILIRHQSHKDGAITGCISSGTYALNVTDEKDHQTYTLSGDTAGVKPGDRMTLQGKRKKTSQTLSFEARGVTKDLGACAP